MNNATSNDATSNNETSTATPRRQRRNGRRCRRLLAAIALTVTGAAAFNTVGAHSASALPISEWQSQCAVDYGFGTTHWYASATGYSCLWKGPDGWARDYYSKSGNYIGTCAGLWGASPRRECIWF